MFNGEQVQVYRTLAKSSNKAILMLPNTPDGTGMPLVMSKGARKVLTPADQKTPRGDGSEIHGNRQRADENGGSLAPSLSLTQRLTQLTQRTVPPTPAAVDPAPSPDTAPAPAPTP